MVASRYLVLYFPLVFCFVSVNFIQCFRRSNTIDTINVDELCAHKTSNSTLDFFLSSSGAQSALKMQIIRPQDNCTVIIDSSISGVILNLDPDPRIKDISTAKCEDIEVFPGGNSTMLCSFKSSSFVSEGSLTFRYIKKVNNSLKERFTIVLTAYREGNGECTSEEYMCYTGECIWKDFECDGIFNCPDGSDEFGSKKICIGVQPSLTLHESDFNWNFILTTPKNEQEYRKSFNGTIIAAIVCATFIFVFGFARCVSYHYSNRRPQRSPYTNLTTFSVIRPRPDFSPQYPCLPPPSYVSSVRENDSRDVDPPEYSVLNGNNNPPSGLGADDTWSVSDPPPPYVP